MGCESLKLNPSLETGSTFWEMSSVCLQITDRLRRAVGLWSAQRLCVCVCVDSHPPPCVSVRLFFWRTSPTGCRVDAERLWRLLRWRWPRCYQRFHLLFPDDEDKLFPVKSTTSPTLATANCLACIKKNIHDLKWDWIHPWRFFLFKPFRHMLTPKI